MKLPNEPEWFSEDAIALRAFCESVHGRRFLARLSYFRPEFMTANDATQRLIESGKIEGYELAESTILIMLDEAKPVKDEGPPSFPSLDDETGVWNDVDIAAQNSTTT